MVGSPSKAGCTRSKLAILAVEAAVIFAMIVLGLFRSLTVLGLTPLYIVSGRPPGPEAVAQPCASKSIPASWIYPASTVMFTATLLSVLLI